MKFSGHMVKIANFVKCRDGNFAIMFAILIPVLLGVTGGVIDFLVFQRQQANMQYAADAAALSAAKEMMIQTWSPAIASSVAQSYVDGNLVPKDSKAEGQYSVSATVDKLTRNVKVSIDMNQYQYFLLGYFLKSPQIHVNSTATASGEAPVCIIGLDKNSPQTILLVGTANVTAPGCVTYSNSVDAKGIKVGTGALLKTASTCSAGGYVGPVAGFSPAPTADCPSLGDPLGARAQPVVGPCDYTSYSAPKKVATTLSPGVYCNGMFIDNGADVFLKPGIYIINGGQLLTKNNGRLTGTGVTLFFTGADGRMAFDGSTTVNLTAPETGPTAGLLVMQDRAMALQDYEISSKSAAELLGTIYLPNGRFLVRAKNKIAESSAFTIIVARYIQITDNSKLIINSNYDLTNVPVPKGFGPGGKLRLIN